MATKIRNYNNGKVYKIEALNGDHDGDIYIGSTTKKFLSQRMVAHRTSYNQWLKGKGRKITSFDIFDKYEMKNCIIQLLETVNCNTRDELLQRESYYIRTLKCVNKVIPNRTDVEYRIDNKDKRNLKNKEYRSNNREKINESRSIKIYCSICDCCFVSSQKARHFKTTKHTINQNKIDSLSNQK